MLHFHLCGQPFMAISAGPVFEINPSISFFVHFDPTRDPQAREKLDALWEELAHGGTPLMGLDAYPFSQRYGWVQDRYGGSWQLMLTNPDSEPRPTIVPSLLFTGAACGRAKEAGEFYRAVFDGSQAGRFMPYPPGMPPDREGTAMYSDFRLGDTWVAAMDSAHEHKFAFNEAISFVVPCRDQAEIDRYWKHLSSDPKSEQCGWCKDRFGVIMSGSDALRLVIVMRRIKRPELVNRCVRVSEFDALNRPRADTSVHSMSPPAPAQFVVVGAGKKDSCVSPATRNHQPSSNR
jgi:predicted 3-demethylubiquinone-9 3-methyltransferase (glyoxalase superfamily)